MMSGLVPTTTMCWLFSWDMGSFVFYDRGEDGRASEEVFALVGEQRPQVLQRAGAHGALLVEDVDGVVVGHDDQPRGPERDDRAAVHAGDEHVVALELDGRADGVQALL